jgi:hypothetical protein
MPGSRFGRWGVSSDLTPDRWRPGVLRDLGELNPGHWRLTVAFVEAHFLSWIFSGKSLTPERGELQEQSARAKASPLKG